MIDYNAARQGLIEKLSYEIRDKRVLEVMSRIPREQFVPPESRTWAYDDRPLPIGGNQTISQPFIIALMTQSLELKGKEKILEIGTGSGYQTAILAELAESVVSVERLPELAQSAGQVLEAFGYNNIEIHVAGDTLGWPPGAPYEAIIVTAGAPKIPDELVSQLTTGGRMVIPVGSRFEQELYQVTRLEKTNRVIDLGGCRFVPLIGKGAWEE
ncbi:MAG TPA: protein-L-isoaspartate(D-aspartate) O-methyltransferase [Dehalococcoidales bacterium]|nr:protein-L-isoaspartate(D-aspartate) O-methyltransferase [Dehalococcoidales bacterium]